MSPDGGRVPPLLAVRHPWLAAASLLLLRGDLRTRLDGVASSQPGPMACGESSRPTWAACSRSSWHSASPIEPFGSLLLQVHMIQHMLLMMVAPPLLWLGAPLFPMIRGIPRADPGLLGRSPSSARHQGPKGVLSPGSRIRPRHWPSTSPPPGSGTSRPSMRPPCARSRLASAATPLFPRVVAPLLVSRGPPLSAPTAMVSLAPPALSPDRRCLEYRPFGVADLLRPSDLSPLRPDPSTFAGISAIDDQSTAGVIMWVPGSVGFLLPSVRDRDQAPCSAGQ